MFFCNSYVKYYALLVIFSLLLPETICAYSILKHFHHILTVLSPYHVKLDTFEMTDIP